jgi:hypothetical protein
MRIVAIALLFLPSACLALGADSEMFIGVAPNGKVVMIKYLSDRQPWSPGEFIYGSANNPKLRYCWTSGEGSDPSDWYLVCTSQQGTSPSVSYKHGQDSLSDRANGVRYKEAMAAFKKLKIDEDSEELLEYYICAKGCGNTVPEFIFEIGFGGM